MEKSTTPKNGAEMIAQEREEQIIKHGRTVQNDFLDNGGEELRSAALALLTNKLGMFPAKWDDGLCRKMISKSYKQRLVIAGAFIAAEIDRLNFEEDASV